MLKKMLFLFSLALILNACSSFEKPTVKELSSVKINIKHKFTKLNGTITFANSNTEPIVLNEFYFDAFFNGNDVGSFTKKTELSIPAQGQLSLPFYIEVNNEEFDTEVTEIELNLKGYIKGKIKDEDISMSFDENKTITPNGKVNDEGIEKTKEELKQEKKEQKKLEKEQKKMEEMKRKASKEINA